MKNYSHKNRFLYSGYTFIQEIEWKKFREELHLKIQQNRNFVDK
jgi:hypothetical protein